MYSMCHGVILIFIVLWSYLLYMEIVVLLGVLQFYIHKNCSDFYSDESIDGNMQRNNSQLEVNTVQR